MRRLFYQTKIYDYSSEKEALKHIEEMKEKGWIAKKQFDQNTYKEVIVYQNGQDYLPYSVEYTKGLS